MCILEFLVMYKVVLGILIVLIMKENILELEFLNLIF